ncbi:MAG TPA: iron-sulfur cluster assembly scaffold protein [Syntrophorhabdaceae bacterium]|nr:iron-sulfur cluster assembly scaffold protein [Syntrophorhabdaceae bacterium]
MSDELDSFLKELQDQIYDETLRDYGRKAFDRWIDPSHMHPMENPDAHGRITGSCGDTMEIFLRFKDGRVSEASFTTDGCGPSMICGSLAAELALGKEPEEIERITAETILETIGGLPEEDQHCASLAANTLQVALHDYLD